MLHHQAAHFGGRDGEAATKDLYHLPPEEDAEFCVPALKAGLNFIRLATPTTDDKRLPAVLANTSGFVYYVSITGITGSASADSNVVGEAVARQINSVSVALSPDIVGLTYTYPDHYVVGREKVREYANALHDEHPDEPAHDDSTGAARHRRESGPACIYTPLKRISPVSTTLRLPYAAGAVAVRR